MRRILLVLALGFIVIAGNAAAALRRQRRQSALAAAQRASHGVPQGHEAARGRRGVDRRKRATPRTITGNATTIWAVRNAQNDHIKKLQRRRERPEGADERRSSATTGRSRGRRKATTATCRCGGTKTSTDPGAVPRQPSRDPTPSPSVAAISAAASFSFVPSTRALPARIAPSPVAIVTPSGPSASTVPGVPCPSARRLS